jgi:hypothetical protein
MNIITEKVRQVYNGQNRCIGVFVGTLIKNKITIGWSRCNLAAGYVFDMKKGVQEAFKHIRNNDPIKPLSHARRIKDFMQKYENFRIRCKKYFKDADFATEANTAKDTDSQFTIQQIIAEIPKDTIDEKLINDFANLLEKIGNRLYNIGVGGCLVEFKTLFTKNGIRFERLQDKDFPIFKV